MNKIFAYFILIFLAGCSKGKQAEQVMDTTAVESEPQAFEDENGGAYDPNVSPFPELQAKLEALEQEFRVFRKTADSLVFETNYELSGGQNAYYFTGTELKFISYLEMGEGGYAGQTLIKIGPGGVIGYEVTTETSGFFAYEGQSGVMTAKVKYGSSYPGTPIVQENHSEGGFTYYQTMNNHLSALFDKLGNFKKVGKIYEWYQRKEKTKSEYSGDVEVIEVYRISPNLFKSNFLPFNAIRSKNLKEFEGFWYLLHSATDGYEWHTICGEGRGIDISYRDGQYIWTDRDVYAAWQATITGFAEGEGDSFRAALRPSGGKDFFVLAMDESSGLLFIDGQPYTKTPNGYTVVDTGTDCDK